MPKKLSLSERRRNARQYAMQALYQWEITKQDISDIEKQFENQADFTASTVDQEHFSQILNGLIFRLLIQSFFSYE